MADYRRITARKRGSRAAALEAEMVVPDCVNTAMNAVEATGLHSAQRPVFVDPGRPKLG